MKFLFLALSPLVLLPPYYGDCTKLHETPQFAEANIAADLKANFEHAYSNEAVHESSHNNYLIDKGTPVLEQTNLVQTLYALTKEMQTLIDNLNIEHTFEGHSSYYTGPQGEPYLAQKTRLE